VRYELSWDGDSEDLPVTMSGVAEVEELGAFREALADPRWRPGLRILIDERQVDWSAMSAADIERRVDLLARAMATTRSHTAVVLGRSLDYGLVRMEQALVERRVPLQLEVFMSLEDARAWLHDVGETGKEDA
jgi:hypothetical protein